MLDTRIPMSAANTIGVVLGVFIGSTSAASVEDIVAAWSHRALNAQSVHYVCDFDELVIVDVFKQPLPAATTNSEAKQVPAHCTVEIAIAKQQHALRVVGESRDDTTGDSIPRYVWGHYDGTDYRDMLGTSRAPLCSEHIRRLKGINVELYPLLLAHATADVFAMAGYDVAGMRIDEPKTFWEGMECIALSIPRPLSEWIGYVVVDPKREFIPVRFAQKLRGDLTTDIEISYKPHAQIGWTADTCTMNEFIDKGRLSRTRTWKVTSVVESTAAVEELFRLTFPVGAHIARVVGSDTEYTIKLANGLEKPISEREFGRFTQSRIDGSSRYVWIGISVVAVGAAITGARVVYRRTLQSRA